MKRIYIILLLSCLYLPSYSQTLQSLFFVNEKEQGREIDRRADMNNMYSFFKEISNLIGYEYRATKFSDVNFTSKKVKESINELKVTVNDIVVFYYSGHGYNDESDIWPSLSLNDCSYREIDILKLLRTKASDAKLILCIADCCNKQANSSYEFTSSYDSMEDSNPIRKLFLGFKGKKVITISASKQGQFSWSHNQYGAYFGNCFRQAIAGVNNSNASWDNILQNAVNLTYRYTNGKQTPQFNITQSGDPFEE